MLETEGKFHAWAGGRTGLKYIHKFLDTFEEAKDWLAKMLERRPDYDAYGINSPDKAALHVSPRIAQTMNLVPVVMDGDKYPRWVTKGSKDNARSPALEQG